MLSPTQATLVASGLVAGASARDGDVTNRQRTTRNARRGIVVMCVSLQMCVSLATVMRRRVAGLRRGFRIVGGLALLAGQHRVSPVLVGEFFRLARLLVPLRHRALHVLPVVLVQLS